MLTSIRGLAAVTFLTGAALVATPALAADADASTPALDGAVVDVDIAQLDASPPVTLDTGAVAVTRASMPVEKTDAGAMAGESGFTASANVSLVTDYRFRGVSLSGGDPALQGGFDISHSSGFYVGTWASTISGGDAYGDLELDLYGGWSGDVAEGVTVDVGLLLYAYPTEKNKDGFDDNVDYWEPYASIGFTLGPVSATVGGAYAWNQDSLGDDDNLYLYTDLEVGIPNTPLTLSGHLGYTDGALAPDFVSGLGTDRTAWDWSIGASMTVLGPISLGVSYVGVESGAVKAAGFSDGFTDDTIVATISAEF